MCELVRSTACLPVTGRGCGGNGKMAVGTRRRGGPEADLASLGREMEGDGGEAQVTSRTFSIQKVAAGSLVQRSKEVHSGLLLTLLPGSVLKPSPSPQEKDPAVKRFWLPSE